MGDAQLPPRRRRRLIVRLARGAGLALAGLLLLVVAVVGALHSASGQEFIRKRVEARLSERMQGSAKIGRLGLKLFGSIELGGVVLSDAGGKPVVELDSLRVVPAWRELSGGHIVIDRVAVSGVRVSMQQDADGGSNLKRLFKPSPPTPPDPNPKRRRIEVRELALSQIGFSLEKPDGSKLAVDDLELDARIDATPVDKTVDLRVTRLALGLERQGEKGAKLALRELSTRLDVALIQGKGKIALGPLSAKLDLTRPGVAPFATPIALGAVEVAVGPDALGATLKKLEAGLALLESLELSGKKGDAGLEGPQKAVIVGLRLDAKRLNEFLAKDLLATSVDLKAAIAGEPDALGTDIKIDAGGGKLSVSGKLDVSRLDRPGYDLTLLISNVATKKLLASPTAPDIEAEKITLAIKGSGAKKDLIEAEVRVDSGPVRIGKIQVDDITLRGKLSRGVVTVNELRLHALAQTLNAHGTFTLADRSLDLKVELAGDIGQALAAAKRAGVALKSNIPPGAIALQKGEFQLEVKGKLDEGLTVSLARATLRVAGGSVALDGNVTLIRGEPDPEGNRALGLDLLNTDIELRNVRLSRLAALRGKKLPGIDGSLNGSISLRGTKRSPKADVDLTIRARRSDDASAPNLVVDLKAQGDARNLDASVSIDRIGKDGSRNLAKLDARLPITLSGRRGLAAGRRMAVKLDLHRIALRDLLPLLPPEIAAKLQAPRETELEAHVELGGTTSAPQGEVKLDATTKLPLVDVRPRLNLDLSIAPAGRGSRVIAKARAFLDRRGPATLTLDADARLGGSPLLPRGAEQVDWKLAGRLSPPPLDRLPLGRDLSGNAALAFDLHGTRHDAGGQLELTLADVRKGETGPIDGKLTVDLEAERTRLALDLKVAGLEALRARGKIGLAGRGLIATLRDKKAGDADLDVLLELPKHRLAEWAVVRPKLEKYLGSFGGALHLAGKLNAPTAKGEIALDDFTTASGEAGRAALLLDAGAEQIDVDVRLGPVSDQDPVAIRVHTARAALIDLLRKKEGDASAAVKIEARAHRKPVASVLPKLTRDFPDTGAQGTFDWDMQGELVLASTDGVRRLADATLLGDLSITKGSVPIPESKRRFHGVELAIRATRDALRIDKLEVHESDREKKDRRIFVTGQLPWSRLRPERVELAIDAQDFLLFGTDTLGMPDAPRGALSAKLEVSGDLSRPRRRIDATVHALNLSMPDRLDKAHWPEKSNLGDVLYLSKKGVAVGKLPRPEAKASPPPAPSAPSAPSAPLPDAPGAAGTDVYLHIPRPIKVQKMPFELVAKGELEVRLRAGKKPAITGELVVVDGYMSLGGRNHGMDPRHRSRIFFDAEHPGGELDLWVRRAPHPVVLADVSLVSSGGDDVRLHLTGPISKPFSTVNGVGNADLWDILPVHNAGRVKFMSEPDLPATAAVQLPREYDVVLLSYMAVNLPHNLFLTRINAWADPHDDRGAYGRVRHLEADRYSATGKTRIRAAARPTTMGQSSAELEIGHLFVNEPHTKVGAAIVAGSRIGGGPALFFEWASDD